MQIATTFVALATLGAAHYNYPSMILDGVITPQWSDVRQWTGYQSYNPVVDVTLVDIRCNVDASTNFAADILSVPAGSLLGFDVFPDTTGIYHPGPLLAYMAKVPSGYTAANWDGSGSVWFKIYEEEPVFTTGAMNWPLQGTFINSLQNVDFEYIILILTYSSQRCEYSQLHNPHGRSRWRLSLPRRADWPPCCLIRKWSTILHLLWSNHHYWRRKWDSWAIGGLPRCLLSYGAWAFD